MSAFQAEEGLSQAPTQCLGAVIAKVNVDGKLWARIMKPDAYQVAAIADAEAWLG